jgi:hypothetical protein
MYFHLLLDAWLTPSNAPFSGTLWFQAQRHIETPAYQSIAAVIDLIADIEAAACAGMNLDTEGKAAIDAVVVGQNLPDHMNYDTLKEVDATVPVFAAEAAFSTMQSWKHFETILQIPEFRTNSRGLDWRTSSGTQVPHLPSWLAIWRIPGPNTTPALHWAVYIIFEAGGAGQVQWECVVQSPHGLYVEDAAVLKSLSPGVKQLALLHTTKESWFYWFKKANLGAKNGAEAAEGVDSRYCKLNPFFTRV